MPTSRPLTVTGYCTSCPGGAGSAPMVPAGATTFCSFSTRAMSCVVTPKRAIFCGSIQMRMP